MTTQTKGNPGIQNGDGPSHWKIFLIAAAFSIAGLSPLPAADIGLPSTGRADETNSVEMRTYLQLQEQLHATQLAVERTRNEAEQTSSQNMEALATRLKTIEDSLATQRSRELDAMQSSNRVMLIVAGSFAGMGFIAMLLMGYFQWRTVNRLAELSSMIPAGSPGMNGRPPLAIGMGESPVVASDLPERPSPQLLETIERLEKRVRELEGLDVHTHAHLQEYKSNGTSGHGSESAATHTETKTNGESGTHEQPANDSESSRLNSLLGKGQSLLNMDKAEEALACFDEALAAAPDDAEALVKKGIALEKLRKLDEAIECYDRAISADANMTIAYLHKGGLFNRMERFNEALECYEKALHTQEKRGLA